MIRRAISVAIAVAITGVALWYLLTPEIVRELDGVLVGANWLALILATACTSLVQWLRAWRFAIMTTGRPDTPDRTLVAIAFRLNFFNFVLPFRLGDLSYPVMMKRAYGQSLAKAGGVLLLARVLDLFTVGAIFVATAAGLNVLGGKTSPFLLWALAAALASAPFAMVLGAGQAGTLVGMLPPEGRTAAIARRSLAALGDRRAQFLAIALSFLIWIVFAGLALIAARAVTAEIGPARALLGASAGNIAFALPINGVGGLGASQAAWAFVVNRAGVPWEDAVISAFALYAVTLAGALLFGGAAMLVRSRD